jgi:hypothetical protein
LWFFRSNIDQSAADVPEKLPLHGGQRFFRLHFCLLLNGYRDFGRLVEPKAIRG